MVHSILLDSIAPNAISISWKNLPAPAGVFTSRNIIGFTRRKSRECCVVFLILIYVSYFHNSYSQKMTEKTYSYLALGDSYTIGESVPANQNFPSQMIELIRKDGYSFNNATIVAKTGWTTDELEDGISNAELDKHYDFVSLLIGVNNQYRGKSLEEYAIEFDELLKKAIGFSGNKANHVIVLSIPDWGVTPYATGRNRQKIASEIDAFNQVNKAIADRYKVTYIDITTFTREAATDPSLLTGDELHPSGKDYKRWAQKLNAVIQQQLK